LAFKRNVSSLLDSIIQSVGNRVPNSKGLMGTSPARTSPDTWLV